MASNLIAMASNLVTMASNLRAMASNLPAIFLHVNVFPNFKETNCAAFEGPLSPDHHQAQNSTAAHAPQCSAGDE